MAGSTSAQRQAWADAAAHGAVLEGLAVSDAYECAAADYAHGVLDADGLVEAARAIHCLH